MPAPGKKILIIDDEIDLAKIAKERLEASGYTVVWASNGYEGLKMAAKEGPDLILLDILMPKKDGFETLSALKADMLTWGIPVIMLSVKTESDMLFKARELGAADYFIKTGDWKDLIKYIERYIA
ncbi:MAG: response regulator [Candidatus Omnitrophota bacterium]|jgi:DNA-binding response OmpR family regulator